LTPRAYDADHRFERLTTTQLARLRERARAYGWTARIR
jgi:hypothetical protein